LLQRRAIVLARYSPRVRMYSDSCLQHWPHYPPSYSTNGLFCKFGPLGPFWAVTITPPKDSTSPSNARPAYPFRTLNSGSSSLGHVCVFPCRRMCHAMPCPRRAHTHAHIMPEQLIHHVPVKPRELALIPNVTSSPGIHDLDLLCRGVVPPA
jgi:hypothetical protein